MQMSAAEAEAVLARDAEVFARAVRQALTRKVNENQFSALVSFAFNVGAGAFRRSSVLKAVNEGRFEAVPHRLMLWVKADGRRLEGLARRRKAEAELFAKAPAAAPEEAPRKGLIGLLIALLSALFSRGEARR
jgi:lysozyme